jgi:hypothetical protein
MRPPHRCHFGSPILLGVKLGSLAESAWILINRTRKTKSDFASAWLIAYWSYWSMITHSVAILGEVTTLASLADAMRYARTELLA